MTLDCLTEISYLDVESLIKKEVFRFKISVDDVMSVAVFYAGHDLLEKSPGSVLRQLKRSLKISRVDI